MIEKRLAVIQANRDDVFLSDYIAALEAAIRPFAKIAEPINGEAGRPSALDGLDRGGTGELFVSSHFATRTREEPLYADDFRSAAKALNDIRT